MSVPTKTFSWVPIGLGLLSLFALIVGGGAFLIRQSLDDGSIPEERSASNPVTTELPEAYPRGKDSAPAFTLVNHTGGKVSLADYRGQPVLLTFAFAHCTTMCPGVIETVKAVRKDLSAQQQPVSLFITIDPDRDKPETLAETASKWGFTEGMHFMSGDPVTVGKVLDAYKIPRSTDQDSGEIVHPALVYVVDAEGRLAYSFSNPTKRWLIDAIHRVSGTSIN
jgi:cytochrome oxidase Cu insertion factor (SCO1/SenC/PrrC family)